MTIQLEILPAIRHRRACPGGTMTIQLEILPAIRHRRACPGGTMTFRLTTRNANGFGMSISLTVGASTGTSPAEAKALLCAD
jgi:hypothetical protein